MPPTTLERPVEKLALPTVSPEKMSVRPGVAKKLIVMIPGQGPNPTQLPESIPQEISDPFEEATKTRIVDIADKSIAELHSENLISSLHALRILGFIAKFRQQYGDILENPNIEYIPASVSQYVANVLFRSWSPETLFKVTHFRDKETQKLANRRKLDYEMLALYNKGILRPDFERGTVTTLDLFQDIFGTSYDPATHKIHKDRVYVASYPSPSTNTLAGPTRQLEKIKSKLDGSKVLGATPVEVVNGAYHSPHMRVLGKIMREYLLDLDTEDPNRHVGRYHSLTTTDENTTSEQIISDSEQLLYLPVFQQQLLKKLLGEILMDPPEEIGVLEFGNSRNYRWGKQQGVQTTCFRDFYSWPGMFPEIDLPPLTTITMGMEGSDYTSVEAQQFVEKFYY